MASQYMAAESVVMPHTPSTHSTGVSQPASANRLGSPGMPGPVMLLMRSATLAKKPIFLLPKPWDDAQTDLSGVGEAARCALTCIDGDGGGADVGLPHLSRPKPDVPAGIEYV